MKDQEKKALKAPKQQYRLESGYKDMKQDQTDEELSEELGPAALDRKQEDAEFASDMESNTETADTEFGSEWGQETEEAGFASGAKDTKYNVNLYGSYEDTEFGTDLGSKTKGTESEKVESSALKDTEFSTDLSSTNPKKSQTHSKAVSNAQGADFGNLGGAVSDTEFGMEPSSKQTAAGNAKKAVSAEDFGGTVSDTEFGTDIGGSKKYDTEIATDFGRREDDTEFASEAVQATRPMNYTEEEDRGGASGIGIFGFILSIASLFIFPAILGPVGAVMGFVAYSRGSRGLGISAIAIGAISFIVYMLLRMAYD
ncbi:hypothetical protein [Marinicrinis lubricantis]|uniref:DUF4190 domain-containing protein n=1 Tax=Marinicrinis lubricantis TaxID=2086470 RepID=A0ABW1IUM8_9BACL